MLITGSENKYFGTDGFRGEANVELTSMHAYKIGRFLGWYYSLDLKGERKPKIIIGKDTRLSSYMLEYSIVAGITASGADAYMLHVTTTPSVSFVTRQEQFDCGVMITASHNPFYDNGIKIVNCYGEKIEDKICKLIEQYLDDKLNYSEIKDSDIPLATGERIGKIIDYVAGRNRYVGYLISIASHSYKNLKIGIDCANGAAWMLAKQVFDALGAKTYVIGCSPNGVNINKEIGSTHIEKLSEYIKNNHLDVGFAFDGDADRCIAVDENGEIIDGDKILYILANRLKLRNMLDNNTVVATIMSNTGLEKALNKIGVNCVRTKVGDKYIFECMQKNGYKLGGEQSGHMIIQKYATTGDGILTAIMLAEEMCDRKSAISFLARAVDKIPQYETSIKVKDKKTVITNKKVCETLKNISDEIGKEGRIILRESGTEPVVRVMVECETVEKCKGYADEMCKVIKEAEYDN